MQWHTERKKPSFFSLFRLNIGETSDYSLQIGQALYCFGPYALFWAAISPFSDLRWVVVDHEHPGHMEWGETVVSTVTVTMALTSAKCSEDRRENRWFRLQMGNCSALTCVTTLPIRVFRIFCGLHHTSSSSERSDGCNMNTVILCTSLFPWPSSIKFLARSGQTMKFKVVNWI